MYSSPMGMVKHAYKFFQKSLRKLAEMQIIGDANLDYSIVHYEP